MKRYLLTLIFLLTSIKIVLSSPTGLWIAQKIHERERGDDARLEMEMTLIDKNGGKRERRLIILRKDFNGEDKVVLRFIYPHDINGTSFLVWEHKGRDNERFLYLPALGRIKRIATREKDENFAGTDFSYEDMSDRKLEDYTYELMEEEVAYEKESCYLLASYPKGENPKYPKILSWVRKDNFVVMKAEYYNKQGSIEKTFKVLKLEEINGIWTPLELLMKNHKTNHQTFTKVRKVQYNEGIPDMHFEIGGLKR